MSLLGLNLKNTLDGLATASGARPYGYVLRRALDFEVAEKEGVGDRI